MIPNKSNIEDINKLISVPTKLYTQDGRELPVTRWEPTVGVHCAVTVSVDCYINFKESEDNEN